MCPPVSPPNVSTLLNVDIHLQDDRHACGRACAEIVLFFLTQQMYQQTELKPPHPNAGTSPDELCALINSKLTITPASADPSLRYKVFAEANRKDALDRIWRGLQMGYPSVGLCRPNADHWVVIRGITEGTPATAHTRNPLPNRTEMTSERPLPDHAEKDACAGWDLANSGTSDEAVSVSSRFCMNPVPADPHTHAYGGRYVVVAPDLPAAGETPEYRWTAPPHDLRVSQLARKRLEETGLLESPEWNDFAAASLVDDDVSVSVDGLTDADDAFDLVQLTNTAGKAALVRLSKAGEFMGAMLEPSEQLTNAQFVRYQQILNEPDNKARRVWSYSEKLFFSPFVFAIKVPGEIPGAHGGPGATYFLRPFLHRRFDSLDDAER